jgi:hypothetical protein
MKYDHLTIFRIILILGFCTGIFTSIVFSDSTMYGADSGQDGGAAGFAVFSGLCVIAYSITFLTEKNK